MILKSYPAGKGDSFLLTWDYDHTIRHLLIDAGTPGTYRHIKSDLRTTKALNAVIITHVDYDHLGGLLKLLDDKELTLQREFEVYMNTPSLALAPSGDDKVKLEHGIKLDILLQTKGITVKGLYCDLNSENIHGLNGLSIQVLSPTVEVLEQLLVKWTAHDLYIQYLMETEASDKVGKPVEDLPKYIDIINREESVHHWEDDLINSSSISFIAKCNGCSILFLGDSNPDLVYHELCRLGWSSTKKLPIDLVKVSHHGCKHNSSKNLFSIIDCKSFLISTDGSAPYYHPDRETIIRLAEYSRTSDKEQLNIYLNYNIETSSIIKSAEASEWNLNIEYKDTFNFSECKCFQKK